MCVSVIISVLNEAQALPALIHHLQRFAAEIVFVDGGSTDGSRDLLEASGYRWLTAHRGRSSQMNAGAAIATGSVLMFVHADTLLPRDAVDLARRAIRRGHAGGSFDVRLDGNTPLLRLIGRAISVRSRITGVATGDQAMFVDRAVFRALGGFAPLPLFEDVEFARRLRRHGSVSRVAGTVVTSARRWQMRGAARTIVEMWTLKLLYFVGIAPRTLARYYEATS